MTITVSSTTLETTAVVGPAVTSNTPHAGQSRSEEPVRKRLSDSSGIATFIAGHQHDSSSNPTSAQNREAFLRSGLSIASDTQPVAVSVELPLSNQTSIENLLQSGRALHIPTAALTFNKIGYGAPTTLGFTSAILTAERSGAFLDFTTGAEVIPLNLRVFTQDTFVDYPVVANLYASQVDVTTSYCDSHLSEPLQSKAVQLLNLRIAVDEQGSREGNNCSLLEIHLPADSILTPLSPVAATKDLEQFAAQSGCVVDSTAHQSLKDYFTQLGIDASSYLHLHNEQARLRISIPKDGSETAIITSFNSDGAPVPIPQLLTNQTPSLSAEIVNKALGFEHGYTQTTGTQDPLHESWAKGSEVLAIPCKLPFTAAAQKIRSWCDACSLAIDDFSKQEYLGNLRAVLLEAHGEARTALLESAAKIQHELSQKPYARLDTISDFLGQLEGLCATPLIPDVSRNPALVNGRPTRLWYTTDNSAFSLQIYRPHLSSFVDYTLSFSNSTEMHDVPRLAQILRTFPSDAVEIKAPFVEDARQKLLDNEPFPNGFSLTFQDLPHFAQFMLAYDPRPSILSELPESILQMRARQHEQALRYLEGRADSVADSVRAAGTILESQLIGAVEVLNTDSQLQFRLRSKSNSTGSPYDDQRFEFYDTKTNLQLEVMRAWNSREITCNLRVDPEHIRSAAALRQNSSLSKDPNVTVRSTTLEDITSAFFDGTPLSGPCYIRNVGNLAQTFLLLREIDRQR